MKIAELPARLRRARTAAPATEGPPSAGPATLSVKATVLRRLELDVTRRLEGLVSGDYLALATGPGSDPAGARPYGPGDDARHIDWNLSARTLAPHVRTTDADRELETCVVVDRSASLDFGTAEREKREAALAAVAAFGFLSVRSGNRLACLITGGDELVWLPPRSGRAGLMAGLTAIYDTPRHPVGPSPAAGLGAGLERVARMQRRRGQIVVVSDFLDASDWATPLRRLCLRHQVIAVHVTDPREFLLPDVGMLGVVDPETGQRLHVQTGSAALRERYRAAAEQRQARIRRSVAEAGAEHLPLSTDRDWLIDVVRFVHRRRPVRPSLRVPVRTAPGDAAGGGHTAPGGRP
ncbi:MAG TPA: DUF58 domain-containing protein [Acidimicrobiales bacterium]|nr:DUF58 domain-containing protein [Acidimicrobiales bacterium]